MRHLVLQDGLLVFDLDTLSGDQIAALRRVFPCASMSEPSAEAPAHIIMHGLPGPEDRALAARPPAGDGEYDILDDGGHPAILFHYRGRADLLIRMTTPVVVSCLRGPDTDLSRVGVHMTWLARQVLARRGALLCHGAALERDGRAVLLYGAPLARKTSLALCAIKAGWRLIADDKFVLSDGAAFAIEHRVNVRSGHMEAFPELASHGSLAAALRPRTRLRRRVLDHAARRLPQSLVPLVRRLQPGEFHGVAVEQVFGPGTVAARAPVSHAVLVSPRGPGGVTAPPSRQVLSQIAALQAMYPRRLARLSLHLAALWPDQAVEPYPLLEGALGRARLLEARLPWSIPTKDAARGIIEAL